MLPCIFYIQRWYLYHNFLLWYLSGFETSLVFIHSQNWVKFSCWLTCCGLPHTLTCLNIWPLVGGAILRSHGNFGTWNQAGGLELLQWALIAMEYNCVGSHLCLQVHTLQRSDPHILNSIDVPISTLSLPRKTAHSEISLSLSCVCCTVCYINNENNQCIDRGQTRLYLVFILLGNKFEKEKCWLHHNKAMPTLLLVSAYSFLLKFFYISTYKPNKNKPSMMPPKKTLHYRILIHQKLQVLCTQWPCDKAMSRIHDKLLL